MRKNRLEIGVRLMTLGARQGGNKGIPYETNTALPTFMTLRRRSKAFSLMEVVITIFIATILTLSVLAGIAYSLQAQKMARERSLAQREAAAILEQTRRLTFGQIEPFDNRPVLVDDNREPENADNNLMGLASLRIYRVEDGVELARADLEDLILVEVEVEWESRGRQRNIILTTHMAP